MNCDQPLQALHILIISRSGIEKSDPESGTGTGNREQEPGIGNRKQDRESGTGNWTWNQGQETEPGIGTEIQRSEIITEK